MIFRDEPQPQVSPRPRALPAPPSTGRVLRFPIERVRPPGTLAARQARAEAWRAHEQTEAHRAGRCGQKCVF